VIERSAVPWAAATSADKPTASTAMTTTRVRRDVRTPYLYRLPDLAQARPAASENPGHERSPITQRLISRIRSAVAGPS